MTRRFILVPALALAGCTAGMRLSAEQVLSDAAMTTIKSQARPGRAPRHHHRHRRQHHG